MSTLVTTNLKHGGAASPNMVLTSDGDVTFGGDVTLGTSVLAAPTGDAPSYTCRAWVNFNGTGTVAIRASGNVSSITDNGTGDYTVNFTTAMPDANYAWSGAAGLESVNGTVWVSGPANLARTVWKQSGLIRVIVCYQNTLLQDAIDVNVAIFR